MADEKGELSVSVLQEVWPIGAPGETAQGHLPRCLVA
jgi:hypothetical protein